MPAGELATSSPSRLHDLRAVAETISKITDHVAWRCGLAATAVGASTDDHLDALVVQAETVLTCDKAAHIAVGVMRTG